MIRPVGTSWGSRIGSVLTRAHPLAYRTCARQRLLSTLAVLELKDGQLNHGSLGAITAAKKLGGSVHAFLAGSNVGPAASEASKVEGVDKILTVENSGYDKVGQGCCLFTTTIVLLLTKS
jgi:electron transfer flavoprotein alpha subunit